MDFYALFKEAIQQDTGLANAMLHMHSGLLILLVARVISGRSIGSFVPLSAVILLELLNELIDRINHGSWRWSDTGGDILNTLFWPTVLTLAVWLHPLAKRQPVQPENPSDV